MKPSVDDIQHALNKAVQIMLKTTQVGALHSRDCFTIPWYTIPYHTINHTTLTTLYKRYLTIPIQNVILSLQRVYQWEKHDVIHQPPAPVVEEGKPTPPVVIKTLYRLVSEHKDVVKVVIVLNSIISSFKMDAKQVLSGMAQFEELWNQVSQWKKSFVIRCAVVLKLFFHLVGSQYKSTRIHGFNTVVV